jgi:hypothetical protein
VAGGSCQAPSSKPYGHPTRERGRLAGPRTARHMVLELSASPSGSRPDRRQRRHFRREGEIRYRLAAGKRRSSALASSFQRLIRWHHDTTGMSAERMPLGGPDVQIRMFPARPRSRACGRNTFGDPTSSRRVATQALRMIDTSSSRSRSGRSPHLNASQPAPRPRAGADVGDSALGKPAGLRP